MSLKVSMKRLFIFLCVICFFLLLGFFFHKPLIIYYATEQLKKIFPSSNVTIRTCTFLPLHELALEKISIRNERGLAVMIGRLTFSYSPASLSKATLTKVFVTDATITVGLFNKSIQEIKRYVVLGSSQSGVGIAQVEIKNASVSIDSQEVRTRARASLVVDVQHQALKACDISIESLSAAGAQFNDCLLRFANNGSEGLFSIKSITYQNASLRNITARPRLVEKTFIFDEFSGNFLQGVISGRAEVSLDAMQYKLDAKFTGLDLDAFVRDFKLTEKIALKGNVDGFLIVEGDTLHFSQIKGTLSAAETGGQLTIKDDTYLKGIAQNSGQSLDIIVESFKDYHYNTADMKLSLEGGNLIFDILLKGEAGKRQLSIVLHDINVTKGEQ